jgi:hypothetical protein
MSYVLTILAFGFVVIGARLMLGIIVIYLLICDERQCIRCDACTVIVQAPPALRGMIRLLRLELRWCMRCERSALARITPPPAEPARAVALRRVAHVDE